MPLSDYDDLFGGNAGKAYRSMVKQYGAKKAREIFFALVEQRKKAKGGALSQRIRSRR